MFAVVLCPALKFPPNTGNVIRLCPTRAPNCTWSNPWLRFQRQGSAPAGLDYHETARVHRHPGWSRVPGSPGRAAPLRHDLPGGASPYDLPSQPATSSSSAGKTAACRPRCWLNSPLPPSLPAHAVRPAQPQSFQRRRRHGFRLASDGFRRLGVGGIGAERRLRHDGEAGCSSRPGAAAGVTSLPAPGKLRRSSPTAPRGTCPRF